jgi:hypothetical protein
LLIKTIVVKVAVIVEIKIDKSEAESLRPVLLSGSTIITSLGCT